MKLTIGDLKDKTKRLMDSGQYAPVVRLDTAVLRATPDDYSARLQLADALAQLGATQEAIRVYRATATLCIGAGLPLVAIVACRTINRLGCTCDDLVAQLASAYGRGSPRLAAIGARLNVETQEVRVDADELQRPQSASSTLRDAVSVGANLSNLGGMPEKFPRDLLSNLSPAALARLVQFVQIHRLPPGHVVVRQGEPGNSLYLVAGGELSLTGCDDLGEEVELGRLGGGAMFGALSCLNSAPALSTATVHRTADLVEVGPEALAAIGPEREALEPDLRRLAQGRLMKNLLQRNTLLRIFGADQKKQLLRMFCAYEVPRNTVLFRAGETSQGIYLLLDGEVEVCRPRAWAGAVQQVAKIGPGSTLGALSATRDEPAAATAIATTQATVLFLSNRLVQQLRQSLPEFTSAVDQMAKRRQPRWT